MTDVEYNRDNFPFAGIFEDLTEETKAKGLAPTEAYAWYQQARCELELQPGPDYFSTAITTGGHARLPDVPEKRQVVAKNTVDAQLLLGEMATIGVIEPRQSVLPADLGYIPDWRQSDYLHLWLAVIGGLDFGQSRMDRHYFASQFEISLIRSLGQRAVQLDTMNDPRLSATERAPWYFEFAGAFADAADRIERERHPAHRLVNLIDPLDSLGCRTERLFAHIQGIPVFDVDIAGPGPTADEVIASPVLRQDLDRIVKFGGTSVDLLPGNQYVVHLARPETTRV